jgi:hypothetical protein
MVPSLRALTACGVRFEAKQFGSPLETALARRQSGKSLRRQNLALRDDLMFDQRQMPPRMKETLW